MIARRLRADGKFENQACAPEYIWPTCGQSTTPQRRRAASNTFVVAGKCAGVRQGRLLAGRMAPTLSAGPVCSGAAAHGALMKAAAHLDAFNVEEDVLGLGIGDQIVEYFAESTSLDVPSEITPEKPTLFGSPVEDCGA